MIWMPPQKRILSGKLLVNVTENVGEHVNKGMAELSVVFFVKPDNTSPVMIIVRMIGIDMFRRREGPRWTDLK